MIQVHLINIGKPVCTFEYKKHLHALEGALRGRVAKMVVVSGLDYQDCPESLMATMKAIVVKDKGIVVFLDKLDGRIIYSR